MAEQNPKHTDEAQQPASASPVESALDDAQASLTELQQVVESDADPAAQGQPMSLPELDGGGDKAARGIELLSDVELDVTVELGRTEMLVEDVLRLGTGSVVELDKLAGDPVDVYVNNRLVARGEVLVLNDNFCIRVSEILANLEEEAQAIAEQGQNAK